MLLYTAFCPEFSDTPFEGFLIYCVKVSLGLNVRFEPKSQTPLSRYACIKFASGNKRDRIGGLIQEVEKFKFSQSSSHP